MGVQAPFDASNDALHGAVFPVDRSAKGEKLPPAAQVGAFLDSVNNDACHSRNDDQQNG